MKGTESTSALSEIFADFVDDCNDEAPTARFSRRSAAAERLLEIASHEYGGEGIVAQMLLDDRTGENRGIRAIFRLSDEEAVAHPLTTTADGPWRCHSTRASSRLLNLVTGYAEASTFFGKTIPQVLADGVWGLPALLFLITSTPSKFLHWTDPFFLPRIGMRATALSPFWSREWLTGITILDLWLRSADREAIMQPGLQSVRVSTAQFILNIGTAALRSETLSVGIETGLGLSQLQDKIVVLQAIISAFLAITDATAFSKTLSLLPSFVPLVTLCVKTLLNSESYHTQFWATWCGLTLKLLAVLREVPAVMETIHAHERSNLARICLDIVLQQTQWIYQLNEEVDSTSLLELRPEEDAHGILCSLPGGIFEIVLREKGGFLAFGAAALSNMSPHIRAVRQAFHRSGAWGFLGRVVNYPMPQGSHFGSRDMWIIKGDAITCIGNIMKQMDAFEFNRQIIGTLVASVGAICEDEEAPLEERTQALYMR
ncbi:hypothetical protein FRC04_010327 [Tulasnella sp. 424]|nr:hypothetical protein FRC04_010327 [Tulasnella sp. 424]